MSAPVTPDPGQGRVVVAVGRLWGGGVATAFVAALIAAVGVLICGEILDLEPIESVPLLPIGDSLTLNYAATAFVLAIAATGLAHVLALTTPKPRSFFRWIVGLATLAAVALPFALTGDLANKLGTAAINLFIGLAIGSLLTAVLARTVTDPDRSWQQP
ncbi:MAG TPA: DUF6069 family protein [Propionibacteriaceae bacterium]|nr:DUF6069 family protein [Propionibacteriaceae bacterium]